MKKLLWTIASAAYMSACAPTTETTQSPTAENTLDANATDDLTTELDTAEAIASDSKDAVVDSASALDADQEAADLPLGETPVESDVLGTTTTLTMDQLPKAVRDAYLNMPGQENRNAVRIFQVKTSTYPILYKIESTSTSTDNVHYYTPDGQEIAMPKFDQ
jgi:hypothetical protein